MHTSNKQKHIVIAYNLRSCENIGSLIRTIDGLGWDGLFCVGTSPYPAVENDTRLPHQIAKQVKKIAKTSLGAEQNIRTSYFPTLESALQTIESQYCLIGLEQSKKSLTLENFVKPTTEDVLLMVGNEVNGLDSDALHHCHDLIEIEMKGAKESLNVSIAAAIAMYQIHH